MIWLKNHQSGAPIIQAYRHYVGFKKDSQLNCRTFMIQVKIKTEKEKRKK